MQIITNPLFKKIAKKILIAMRKLDSVRIPIASIDSVGSLVDRIKLDSVESVTLPPIFNSTLGGEVEVIYPKIDLIKYHDAWFFPRSDFIISQGLAIWHKFHSPHFWRMIPRDNDFLGIKNGNLVIRRPKKYIAIKNGFFLCGISSTIWSHFLVEHLPKLYYLSKIKNDSDEVVTIILPKHTDDHIREIIDSYLLGLSGVEVIELGPNEAAKCDVLHHISNTAFFMDDMTFGSSCDDVQIPRFVADSLKSNLIPSFQLRLSEGSRGNERLYLARLGNVRNLQNAKEVEGYFLDLGFRVIYPHLLTLQEKINAFSAASAVVGPASSAFTNLIFSQPKTKVICFVNYFRCYEPYTGFTAKHFDLNILMVTGSEALTSGSVAEERDKSYLIPLEKIKAACKFMDII